MKLFLSGFIFTYLSIQTSQVFFKTFVVFDDKSFWLIVLAVALLNIFKRPMLKLVSLPSKGVVFQFISAFLTAVLLDILASIITDFRFVATQTPSFNLFGFMIPSTYLSAFQASVFCAIAISLVSNFFYWLSNKKDK